MKKILFVVSALAILMGISASCQKELNNGQAISAGEGTTSSLVVTATIADHGTKVSYAEDGTTPNPGLKPTWEENDIIIGFDGDGNTYGYKVTAVNDGKATLTRETSGDYVGTATSDPADGTKMYMIYSPGAKPSDIMSKSLTVSIANQEKDVVPAFMTAQAEVSGHSLSLKFSNKMAVVGIKSPKMAIAGRKYTSVSVTGSSLNTTVNFALDGSGNLQADFQNPGIITKAVDFTSDASTKQGPEIIYIVTCPLQTASELSFYANNGEYFTKSGVALAASNYYYTTPAFKPGAYTANSDGKKVRFTKGNLYWDGSKWALEQNQYDYRGYPISGVLTAVIGGNKTYTPANNVGWLLWTETAEKSIELYYDNTNVNKTTSAHLFCDGSDADHMLTVAGQSGLYALSLSEWAYIWGVDAGTSFRASSSRVAKAKVHGVKGLLVFPDMYAVPNIINSSYINNITTTYFTTISDSNWSILDEDGVLFLPAAGYRNTENNIEVTEFRGQIGERAYYWTSTANNPQIRAGSPRYNNQEVGMAGNIFFRDNNGNTNSEAHRFRGYAIRLASDVQ